MLLLITLDDVSSSLFGTSMSSKVSPKIFSIIKTFEDKRGYNVSLEFLQLDVTFHFMNDY